MQSKATNHLKLIWMSMSLSKEQGTDENKYYDVVALLADRKFDKSLLIKNDNPQIESGKLKL